MNLLPTIVVPNFVTDSELAAVLDIIQEQGKIVKYNANDIVDGETDKVVVSSLQVVSNEQVNPIMDILGNRLTLALGATPVLSSCWVLTEHYPLGLHTDSFQLAISEQEDLYYTIIIPVDNFETCTVLTNQYCDVARESQTQEVYLNEYLKGRPLLPKDQRITDEFWKQNLSHSGELNRPFFSLEQTFKWTKGSLLAFDRRKWHASDNFLKNGLDKKVAIVSFTSVNRP
jgi:hypothetical protein